MEKDPKRVRVPERGMWQVWNSCEKQLRYVSGAIGKESLREAAWWNWRKLGSAGGIF